MGLAGTETRKPRPADEYVQVFGPILRFRFSYVYVVKIVKIVKLDAHAYVMILPSSSGSFMQVAPPAKTYTYSGDTVLHCGENDSTFASPIDSTFGSYASALSMVLASSRIAAEIQPAGYL